MFHKAIRDGLIDPARSVQIGNDAPHPQAALEWINTIERPEVHAAITNEVFYPNADAAARKFMRPESQSSLQASSKSRRGLRGNSAAGSP